MRLLCCAFCFVFAFAVMTSLHLFTIPEGESGRRYLRRFSKMVLDATAQSPQWKDGPLVIPPEFKKFARVMPDGSLFVLTGDIADMWIRDSAAQVWPYRDTHPEMVKRVLQRQGMYILSDPYANSYKDVFRAKVSAADKRLGRGGWVATRNYEVDSGCYFLRLLHHMWKHHGLDARPFESAASALISTYVVEQRHEDQSPYRYPELPRNGKGAKTAYTGMTWGAFRPSDDACKYGYHIPSNLFVAEVMDYAAAMWGGDIRSRALRLQKDVLAGIAAHGIKDGMYCYEVDGLGHCNMMDDANVPSLLSIPYINSRHYDRAIWQNTYAWIWSVSNPYFFVGKEASGIGSPHTPRNHIWPMSIIVRGLVDPSAKSEAVQTIERTRTPAIHESFHKDNAKKFTRPWFGWVNALYAELKGASAPFEPSSGVVGGGDVREVAKRVEAKTNSREVLKEIKEKVNVQSVHPTTYSWRFCKYGSQNRSQDLLDQLQCVVKSLHASNESYFIYLGTLIGYARDNGINPYEVDNDIVIEKTLDKPKFAKFLSQCGMILFKYGIWRACMLSDEPRKLDTPPWRQYLPYTDFYTAQFDPFVDWDFHKNYGRLSIEKRPFYGMQISIPSIYSRLLTDRYGNWTKPPQKKTKYNQHPVLRQKTKVSFKNAKRAYLWDTANGKTSSIYSVVYSLIREFEATGTPIFLYAGSVLGARRHHGLIPWDKDVDLALFSTDAAFVKRILNSLNMKWHINRGDGFGFHIDTEFKQYIDIWMYERIGNIAKCVGVDNGCMRWHRKMQQKIIEYNASVFFPPVYAPFGPYILPIPHDSTTHLNLKYTNNWREKCGGWTRGKNPCAPLKRLHPFVRLISNHREELWKGKSLLHTFSVRNNTYVLERSQSA